ncbi:MAG: F0F1 ATP synthase subunit B [Eubacteriales bacterium]
MILSNQFILSTAEVMTPRLFDLDAQLLADATFVLIAVFVLFIALSYLLFNPARKLLTGRQEKIKEELESAASGLEDAKELKAEYEAKLSEIDKEAEEILADARKKALANENKIIVEAKEEAARIMERANVEAELEKKKVADEVKQEIIAIASVMAGKVVASAIDTTVQENLIQETLKEIGDNTWLS